MKVTMELCVNGMRTQKVVEMSNFGCGITIINKKLDRCPVDLKIVDVTAENDEITLHLRGPEKENWRTGEPFEPSKNDLLNDGWEYLGQWY